jgi:hypothetical protein
MVTTQGAAWHPRIPGKSHFLRFFDPGGDPPFGPFVVPLYPLWPLCSSLCIAPETAPEGQLINRIIRSFRCGGASFFSFGRENGFAGEAGEAEEKFPPFGCSPKGEMFSSASRSSSPISRSKGSLARLDAFKGKVSFPGPRAFPCFAPAVATFVFYQLGATSRTGPPGVKLLKYVLETPRDAI